jgi:UDP-N-acetylmuramate dehydrogenase
MAWGDTTACFEIKSDEPLKPRTTFKIGGAARYFASVTTPADLRQVLAFRAAAELELFVLGGGSNILISDRGFDGLVVHPANQGIAVTEQDTDAVTLRVSAAETWDHVVASAVEQGWWGIENLSHIPGQAGAALVQNIGAYGQQLSDVLVGTEVVEIETGAVIGLAAADCGIGYRQSIFNTTRKGRLVISNLTLRLAKIGEPNLRYPDVAAYFSSRGITRPTLLQVRQAIIAIRDRKFPFPTEERGGNAGSFFKNLGLNAVEYKALEAACASNFGAHAARRLREIRSKSPTVDVIKIPTAFLMDVCRLKGYRIGGASVNETQPLVLLNQGGATADDVLRLARHVRRTIYSKTGIVIELEPELVGFSPAELAEYLALE